ncbi:MAG TPA: TlpA disulfide reductase family protein [Pyrinomonadaceae bacterium]|nr:TlpA disulfide reductase family protein [Pyrinomonadaceae bacterium]
MKKLLLLLLIAAACTAFAFAQSGRRVARTAAPPVQPPLNPEPEIPQPKPVPAVLTFLPERVLERRIRTLDNNYFRLADFQGKVIVINLWASWCGPCRREVPEYEAIRKDFIGRDVEFIGLTTEDPAVSVQQVNKFVRQTGFGFLLGWADRELAGTLMNGRRGVPQTLVVDTNGNIINHWVGYAPRQSGTRLRETIENALK